MSDEISVVIAAYNAEPFVDFCLTGVLNQTLQPTRVIAVDDASEDGTYEALRSWSDRLPMQVLRNSENTGAGSSRSRALAEIRGGKVAILDADDFWLPEHLQVLSSLMCSPNVIAVPRAAVWISGQGLSAASPFQKDLPDTKKQFSSLRRGNPVFTGSMFDCSIVEKAGGYPKARLSEDYLFWYRCLKVGVELRQSALATVLYRRHETNASGSTSTFFSSTAELFKSEQLVVGSDSLKVIDAIAHRNEVRSRLASFDESQRSSRWGMVTLILKAPMRLKASALLRLISGSKRRHQKTR